MPNIYRLLRPLLFNIEPEKAHHLTLALLRNVPLPQRSKTHDLLLGQSVAGLRFPGPVGLAAGFDKDGLVAHRMGAFGFGFAELGTLTPLPQGGNPLPRLFRLVEDEAVINRMGFNNGGQAEAAMRLARIQRPLPIPLGINIGANKDSADRIADYEAGVRTMAPLADYLTVNISSPNTPGLRALQDAGALDDLLARVISARAETGSSAPVFLKVAPDLEPADIEDICRIAVDRGIDALIVSNTTISRPVLASPHSDETGGLSGKPLHDLAHQRLIDFRRRLGAQMPLIGVGGIASAEQAYARIRAGASLVQLYSALVYKGPWLARQINDGLAMLLKRDGFTSITQAVGVDTD